MEDIDLYSAVMKTPHKPGWSFAAGRERQAGCEYVRCLYVKFQETELTNKQTNKLLLISSKSQYLPKTLILPSNLLKNVLLWCLLAF